MKKKINILIIIIIILNVILPIFQNISFANTENEKKNAESYWSKSNAPIFYGATEITIKKDIIEEFNPLDTRFRIFAKDFEDGEISTKIQMTGEVDIHEVGEYQINYSVTDSHGNKTTLTVPVTVTDDDDAKINVVRTLYTIPSVWNMDLVGFSRCNYGDRQLLGIYMPRDTSIKAKILQSDNDITMQFITDDAYNDSSITIPNNGEWVTLQNGNGREEQYTHDSVPLLTSTVLSKEKTDLTKTFKIELEYDETVKELTYYHYKDDETKFFEKWHENQHSYAVVENEAVMVVVPLIDIDRLIMCTDHGFPTLDSFLEYYLKVVNKMDEIVGLDLNPEKLTDQNVRTQYLVRANAHGAGGAYYAGSHVGVSKPYVYSFFEMNWGGLHELAHGYQGELGRGEMGLGETSNNILGHYIQMNKDIYSYSGDWLGKLSAIEEAKNAGRLAGAKYNDNDVTVRLYLIINLFDFLEGEETYAKMFKWYREQKNNGRTLTNQDAYVEAIADIYNINIIPYMESWGLNISDETQENVYSKNYPLVGILKDMTSEETLDNIMDNENIQEKYTLVTNEILDNYDITGDVTLNIEIDDIKQIKDKEIIIKKGEEIVRKEKILSNQIQISELPVGNYYVQMPISSSYEQGYLYIQVKENQNNVYTYKYENTATKDYNNYLQFKIQGIYGTYGYSLTFSDNNSKATISYPAQANIGVNNNVSVKIYNELNQLVSDEGSTDKEGTSESYFDFNKGTYTIDIKPEYKIEIKHNVPSKVKVFSTLSGKEIEEYKATTNLTTYRVTETGIVKEGVEDSAEDIMYDILKDEIYARIQEYKDNVTEEELNNKIINFKKKAEIVGLYNQLKEENKETYSKLIEQINRGGVPKVKTVGKLEYDAGEQINLYRLISATDNEDGDIFINEENTEIEHSLDMNVPGIYKITYKVSDVDGNITKHSIQINVKETPIQEPDGSEQTPPTGGDSQEGENQTPPTGGDSQGGENQTPPTGGDSQEGENQTPPTGDNTQGGENQTPPTGDNTQGGENQAPSTGDNTQEGKEQTVQKDDSKQGENSKTSSGNKNDLYSGKIPKTGQSVFIEVAIVCCIILIVLRTMSLLKRSKRNKRHKRYKRY